MHDIELLVALFIVVQPFLVVPMVIISHAFQCADIPTTSVFAVISSSNRGKRGFVLVLEVSLVTVLELVMPFHIPAW